MPRLRILQLPGLPKIVRAGLLAGLLLSRGASVPAFEFQNPGEAAPLQSEVTVQALTDRSRVTVGDRFLLYVIAQLEPGWHIYSLEAQGDPTLPTRIALPADPFVPLEDWRETEPQIVHDPILDRMAKVHSGRVEFQRPFQVPPDLAPGIYPLKGVLTFRSCNNKVCTAARKIGFNTRIEVVPENRS